MRAYVTLLATDDFLYGTLTLWQSLIDVKSEYPQVVIINDNLSQKTLDALSLRKIKTHSFPFLSYHKKNLDNIKGKWSSNLLNTANKLNVFRLIEYEKIVYLDSDMLVMRNIDWLFERPHGSAVIDQGPLYDKYKQILEWDLPREYYMNFNSGLLVIEPSEEIYNQAINIFNETPGFDQEIIRKQWPNWINDKEKQLPVNTSVFAIRISFYLYSNIVNFNDIYILHFVSQKPFMKKNVDLQTAFGLCEKIYLEVMNKAINRFENKKDFTNKNVLVAVPTGGISYFKFKNLITIYLKRNIPQGSTALDVGFGQGIYGHLQKDFFKIDGIDIYEPSKNQNTERIYSQIYIKDICSFEYEWYDLVIMGDVLEHLSIENAQKVINYAKEHSNFILVAIPYCQAQVFTEGNTYETHLQSDLTHDIFLERYGNFKLIRCDKLHGYYFWKKS